MLNAERLNAPRRLIIRNIRELMTCAGPAPLGGSRQREVSPIRDATIASHGGRIVFVGAARDSAAAVSPVAGAVRSTADRCRSCRGSSTPTRISSSPATAATNCAGDLAGRPTRRSPRPAAASCRPSPRPARRPRRTWSSRAARRLDEMLACGTTTCEIKSGYGLELETELQDAARDRARSTSEHAVDVVRTFMGAHEVPPEFRQRRAAYVDLLVDEMIPAVARTNAAEWCDVFCEDGVFTPEESTRILEAGTAQRAEAADPRRRTRRRAAARRWRRRSARGRPTISSSCRPSGIEAMARAGVTATLLPNAAFYLKLGPVRAGAGTDRRRCAGRAGDRRQSRRRLFAVDAIRDVARLLRHEPDVRGGARRRDVQRAPGRSTAPTRSAASKPASVRRRRRARRRHQPDSRRRPVDRGGRQTRPNRVDREHVNDYETHRADRLASCSPHSARPSRRLGWVRGRARGRGRRVAPRDGGRPAEAAGLDDEDVARFGTPAAAARISR